MRKPYHQGLRTPRPGERNDQATFQRAVLLGRSLQKIITDLTQELTENSFLPDDPRFPIIGYEFFAHYFSPHKLWLFATDQNIKTLSRYIEMRNIDGLVHFIKATCQQEFILDAKQEPEDRQFSPEACEFVSNLAPAEFLIVRES